MGEAKLRREREERREMRGTCQTCEHFSAMTKECREDSRKGVPAPGPNGQIGVFSYWPQTEASLWCGKHKPDPQAVANVSKTEHVFSTVGNFSANGAGR